MITGRVVLSCLILMMSVGTLATGRAADNAGERAYNANCKQCHGPEGRGAQAPALVPFKWSDAEALGLVREPACDMPPIPESDLSDEAVGEIVAFLKTIK
jgi:mono/diheme cytochrome c family protein